MNLQKISLTLIAVFCLSTLFSQREYLTKMPGVKTLESVRVSYDKEGQATRKLMYVDSFDTSGNHVLRRYQYGGGTIFEYTADNRILRKQINFPDCVAEITMSNRNDTILLRERLIETKCNYGPPPPPMRIISNYDSMFTQVARTIPNTADDNTLVKIVTDEAADKVTYLTYTKPRRRRAKGLNLQSIEEVLRINKHNRIRRLFMVVRDQLIMERQEVLDNNDGIIKLNQHDGREKQEWFEVVKYPRAFKYKRDRQKNWISRTNQQRRVVAERNITYY
ncbi:MAG: hypothetical protein AAFN81_09495 [Bacteroidota bacterium]